MPRSFRLVVARPLLALSGAALIVGLASGATASAKSTTTTTTAPATTTTTAAVSQADTWLLKAIGAEAKLGSVRINGTIFQGKTNIYLSLQVNGDGEGGGTFKQQGSLIHLKRVGPLLYFNAPEKFWAAHATKAQTKSYGGKWIEVSALDSRFQSFDQFLNASDLVQAVFQGHTTPLSLSRTTLNGRKVEVVTDTVTVKGKKTTGKMYIAATGKPFVLKIVDRGPTENGTISFTSYGKPVAITTPPEPINLTQ
ncbi:MAG TPA: hypothetical protein VG298_11850 [Acidimicrobiales bacterium]|nr:hypothetical protein [Acidimicrobiales bacterium]